MGNTFFTDKEAQGRVAATALSVLRRQLVLPATVYRDAESDFNGRVGDTVTIRKPATLTSRTYASRTSAIVVDDLTEDGVAVAINNNVYSAVEITDEQMEFEVDNFSAQVVAPQLAAVAEGAENVLAAVFNGLAGTLNIKADGTDVRAQLIKARKALNDKNVPLANRWLALSTDVEEFLLNDDNVTRVDASGSDTALRQASIPPLYGFNIFTSNALTPGTAVAYSRDAFAFCMKAPRVPAGATAGSSMSYQGLALRWMADYQSDYLQDRSIVSVLCGATVLDANRAVKINTTGLSS